MQRPYITHLFVVALLCGALVVPIKVKAATVYVTADSDFGAVGDTAVAEVRINTENERVNVVEGDIIINSAVKILEVRSLNDAGSNIQYWSRKPSLSNNKQSISFVGGTPGGFVQKDALLFKIYFQIMSAGQASLAPSGITAYKNDGKGTAVSVAVKPLLFTASAQENVKSINAWKKVVTSDIMPPEFLAATEGRDLSMYDNQIYLVITASDYQSGIERFEVQEGDLPFVRTGSEYVLRDQTKQSRVVINAYDSAGNVRALIIEPKRTSDTTRKIIEVVVIVFGLILAIAIIKVLKKYRRLKHIK